MKKNSFWQEASFWAQVITTDAAVCWEWPHGNKASRPTIVWKGERWHAHRIAWALANGQPLWSEGNICHECDNIRCINPAHLFLGTRQQNLSGCWRTEERTRDADSYIINCCEMGVTVPEIAKLLNRTESTVLKRLRIFIWENPHPSYRLAKRDSKMVDMRNSGMTFEEIGRRFGLSTTAVWKRLRGVKSRRRERPCNDIPK